MPIVKTKSDWHGDKVDPARQKGRPIVAQLAVTNAADDSSGSSYHLIDLPSDCILTSGTAFRVQDWGFAAIRIGTRTDVDALVNQLKSAENVANPVAKFATTFHGKPLWQALGLSENPGGTIGLYAHAIAGATGAGAMQAEIHYLYR